MSEHQSDAYEHLDAAYVLGALEPDERREYEAHLRTCTRCSAAVAELAGLPSLLALVPAADVESELSPENAPVTLLPTLIHTVGRRRRMRRVYVAAGSLAAAACLIAGTVAVVHNSDSTPTAVAPANVMTALRPGPPVDARISLTAKGWGTQVDVRCGYHEYSGTPPPSGPMVYTLWAIPRTGTAQQIGGWRVLSSKAIKATAPTDLTIAQISSIEIRGKDGTALLTYSPSK